MAAQATRTEERNAGFPFNATPRKHAGFPFNATQRKEGEATFVRSRYQNYAPLIIFASNF